MIFYNAITAVYECESSCMFVFLGKSGNLVPKWLEIKPCMSKNLLTPKFD
ncbi:hypothetical protein LguiA_011266 [Lonicera macranthoides]